MMSRSRSKAARANRERFYGSIPEDEQARWEAEGRRAALDGMDLPDGAYMAMADEMGLDPADDYGEFDEDEG